MLQCWNVYGKHVFGEVNRAVFSTDMVIYCVVFFAPENGYRGVYFKLRCHPGKIWSSLSLDGHDGFFVFSLRARWSESIVGIWKFPILLCRNLVFKFPSDVLLPRFLWAFYLHLVYFKIWFDKYVAFEIFLF